MLPQNSLLISCIGDIGKVGILRTQGSSNQQITAIKTTSDIDVDFLYYQILAKKSDLIHLSNSSVVPILNSTSLKKLKISYPASLQTQKHIASILDKADALRQQNRQLLAHYDALLQSTFIEMFGDPVENEKNWPIKPLKELAKIERGRFSPRPRNDPSYFEGQYPFIQTGDISSSNHRLIKWQQTLNEKGIKVSKKFPIGTIVVAIVGATIGASSILKIDTYAPDSIVGISVNRLVLNNYYLEFILRYWKPIFLAQAPATARANINLETFKPLPIPLPSILLQQRFCKIVEDIEVQKQQAKSSLAESEALFQGLLATYFGNK